MRCALVPPLLVCFPALVVAQAGGTISGRITESESGLPVVRAIVEVGARGGAGVTDSSGTFLIRALRPGVYRVGVRAAGFRSVFADSVVVESGKTVLLEITLVREALAIPGLVVEATPDPLLDPQVTQSVHRVRAEDLRELPVTTLSEAVALQAGVVGGSVRGGRVGQQSLIIDGLGLKNQLDASSGPLGLRIPPAAIQEASLITSGFSARYGQALSGIVTAVTKEGGDRLAGHVSLETDRPLPDGWDVGLDRVVAVVGGPLVGSARFLAVADAQARVDDDPVNAPPPPDSLDPRFGRPWLLPHAAGERYDLLGKLTIPLGRSYTLRALGLLSESQRELFDPVLKYSRSGSGERVQGRLAMLHLERMSARSASTTVVVDARLGFFEQEATRAPLLRRPRRRVGSFTFRGFDFAGSDIARSRDTVRAGEVIPGFLTPTFERATPWGVPAFFMTSSPRGELRWNRFRELRGRLDVLYWSRPEHRHTDRRRIGRAMGRDVYAAGGISIDRRRSAAAGRGILRPGAGGGICGVATTRQRPDDHGWAPCRRLHNRTRGCRPGRDQRRHESSARRVDRPWSGDRGGECRTFRAAP